jgi:spermidine synthase
LIRAAGHYYQRIHDLSKSNANRNTDPKLAQIANYYELPYKVFGKKPGHVAIVGAGTGNDVAAALRQGATRVEAIEIDPAIWKLGKLFHPEKPYDDPRVTSVINDARTFLRTTDSSFDMIVYGLLDSHTLLSHASSVRLDSYIYTVEALREAILRLKDGGLLSLSFCVLSAEIGRKIYLMMEEAFGSAPICILSLYDHSVIFFQNKEGNFSIENSVSKEIERLNISDYYSDPKIKADVSTDDWPFFYMPKRVYPKSYLGILALMMVLSTYTVFVFYRQNMVFANPAFFFMGTGFMLIETKAITEMGLVFGNTWHVIVIVIASILLMAFIANCFVQIFRINKPFFPFLLLIISLIVGYTASVKGGFDSTLTGKISTVVILTCPMLFSGIIFSSLLGQSKALTGVMAVNLIGAMLGGVLEYNSMYFGFSFLYIAAIFLYILAMVSFFFIKGIR